MKNNNLAKPSRKRWLFLLSFISLFTIQSSYFASEAKPDLTPVVRINLTNPDDGLPATCTGVLISSTRVATVASCLVSEETYKQVGQVNVCVRAAGARNCYQSKRIISHSKYLGAEGVNASHNLAYIDLSQAIKNVKPVKELTPADFEALLKLEPDALTAHWSGYRAVYAESNLSRVIDIDKAYIPVSGIEFDYVNQRFQLDSVDSMLGRFYEGAALLVQHQGSLYLLGFSSTMRPDKYVLYYPEVNPCDEDPIIVRYPKPIIRSNTQIAAYPVAACGMTGYQLSGTYTNLSCKRMSRSTSLKKALAQNNPVAMRQKAQSLLKQDDTTDSVIEIYQLLHGAIESGETDSSVELARLLIEGEVFPRDISTATDMLTSSNTPEAHLLLAKQQLRAYVDQDMRSINSEVDTALFKHLEIAAQAGYSEAQYYLGRLYQFGVGVEESSRTAYKWYAFAAMQGEPRAQFQLGTMWVDGRGVRSYPQVGHYWIRQAAARGYAKAQNYLALNKGQHRIDDALNEYEFEYSDTD